MNVHDLDEDRYRWGRTAPVVNWSDPNDETVVAGLELRCGACKAQPGHNCTSSIDGGPLPGRLIHHSRIEVNG